MNILWLTRMNAQIAVQSFVRNAFLMINVREMTAICTMLITFRLIRFPWNIWAWWNSSVHIMAVHSKAWVTTWHWDIFQDVSWLLSFVQTDAPTLITWMKTTIIYNKLNTRQSWVLTLISTANFASTESISAKLVFKCSLQLRWQNTIVTLHWRKL